eukprot:tig00000663_g2944.t1
MREDERDIRTLYVSGLPEDVRAREVYLFFRQFDGYTDSVVNFAGKPIAFVSFETHQAAIEARDRAQGLHFDPHSSLKLKIELAKANQGAIRRPNEPGRGSGGPPPASSRGWGPPGGAPGAGALFGRGGPRGGRDELRAEPRRCHGRRPPSPPRGAARAGARPRRRPRGFGAAPGQLGLGGAPAAADPLGTLLQTLAGVQQAAQPAGAAAGVQVLQLLSQLAALQQARAGAVGGPQGDLLKVPHPKPSSAPALRRGPAAAAGRAGRAAGGPSAAAAILAAALQQPAAGLQPPQAAPVVPGALPPSRPPPMGRPPAPGGGGFGGAAAWEGPRSAWAAGRGWPGAGPSLFVANVGSRTTEEDVRKLFERCYGYRGLRFTARGAQSFAFVEFQDAACSAQAMSLLQGFELPSSDRGGIRIEYAKSIGRH